MDYAALRKKMLKEQLIQRGIENQRVLDAFYSLERHKFIPEALRESAYADYPLAIGENQTISQPFIAALMTESLDLSGRERILEIGTGSGYQTAILATLAKEVYSVERIPGLAAKAEALLKECGYANIKVKIGDGTLGWQEHAPFDRIIVTAASPIVPEPLIRQLGENGKLVLPLGQQLSQVLTVIEKRSGGCQSRQICGCVFVPLVGRYGLRDGFQ